MNSFGDLLPRYAGGTSEVNQPIFQFFQDDGEQENTVVGMPESIRYKPDAESPPFYDDITP